MGSTLGTTDRHAAHLGAGGEGAIDLADLFPAWQREAACAGLGNERWYSERIAGQDNHSVEAKKVCATCRVAVQCLDSALEQSEEFGIWGGAGEAERRTFLRCRPERPHGHEPVDGCACTWCAEWARHRANLDALAAGGRKRARRGDRNGAGATHGRRATFARGCRCAPCTWSASTVGQIASRLGQSTADLWKRTDGDHGPVETVRLLDVAVVDLVVDAVVALCALAGVGRTEAMAGVMEWAWTSDGRPQRPALAPWLAERGDLDTGQSEAVADALGVLRRQRSVVPVAVRDRIVRDRADGWALTTIAERLEAESVDAPGSEQAWTAESVRRLAEAA